MMTDLPTPVSPLVRQLLRPAVVLQHILELDSISSWHENTEVGHTFQVLKIFDKLCPGMELLLLEVDVVIVDLTFIRETIEKLEYLSLDVLAEPQSGVILGVILKIGSSGPHKRKDEHHGACDIRISSRHFVEVVNFCQFLE